MLLNTLNNIFFILNSFYAKSDGDPVKKYSIVSLMLLIFIHVEDNHEHRFSMAGNIFYVPTCGVPHACS